MEETVTRTFSSVSFATRPDGLPIEWETFKHGQWAGVRAQYRRLSGPIKYDLSIVGSVQHFVLLDLYREEGETLVGGLPRITNKDLRNKFIFAGPESSISGWSRIEKAGSFVLVELDSERSDETAGIEPIFMRAGALMRSVLSQFKTLLIDESQQLPTYAETLGIMLREELKRIDKKKRAASSDEFGLTPRQLKAAIAYMDDRIDQDVTVGGMAENLGMSPFHFIRMFKRSAGLPPHKFFVGRRIDRAKELLRSPHLSISEVAEMSGFGGATQLTRAFQRFVGTNPSTFRKELS